MLIRSIVTLIALFLLSLGHAHAACGPDTPPALAAANGLTCEVFVDNWTAHQNTNSIDTGNTLNPLSCPNATFPDGACHWYVNNAFPKSAMTVCSSGTGSNAGGFCTHNIPPTTTFDYSVSAGGLLLQPQQLTVTGNTVSGSNLLTNISNTTGVATAGNAVVVGPGVAAGTTFSLSGTTATLSSAATSTNTGATYVLGNVHNGWMLNTCGPSPTGNGYVGTTFTGSMYVEITVPTNPTSGANWRGIESEPEFWAWPIELFTGGPPANLGSNLLNIMEMDFFDYNGATSGQRVIYNEAANNSGALSFVFSATFGGPYYGYGPDNVGGSPYGALILAPSTNAGGAGIGQFVNVAGGGAYSTLNYGPAITPVVSGLGGFSGTPPVGAFSQLPQLHYCLQLDAAPDYPMTVTHVAVWQAPPTTGLGGGGRKSMFR